MNTRTTIYDLVNKKSSAMEVLEYAKMYKNKGEDKKFIKVCFEYSISIYLSVKDLIIK